MYLPKRKPSQLWTRRTWWAKKYNLDSKDLKNSSLGSREMHVKCCRYPPHLGNKIWYVTENFKSICSHNWRTDRRVLYHLLHILDRLLLVLLDVKKKFTILSGNCRLKHRIWSNLFEYISGFYTHGRPYQENLFLKMK